MRFIRLRTVLILSKLSNIITFFLLTFENTSTENVSIVRLRIDKITFCEQTDANKKLIIFNDNKHSILIEKLGITLNE